MPYHHRIYSTNQTQKLKPGEFTTIYFNILSSPPMCEYKILNKPKRYFAVAPFKEYNFLLDLYIDITQNFADNQPLYLKILHSSFCFMPLQLGITSIFMKFPLKPGSYNSFSIKIFCPIGMTASITNNKDENSSFSITMEDY